MKSEKAKKIIEDLVIEWCYRIPDGIPDLNDSKKIKVLYEILKEKKLLNILLSESKSSSDSSLYVFYVDYFQPMTKGHYEIYKKIKNEFKNLAGENIYLITDDKTAIDKPFDYNFKVKIIKKYGISDKKIIKVANIEDVRMIIDSKIQDKNNVAAIFVVDKNNKINFKNGKKETYSQNVKELIPVGQENVFYEYQIKNKLSSQALVYALKDDINEREKDYFLKKYLDANIAINLKNEIIKKIKINDKAEEIANKKEEEKSQEESGEEMQNMEDMENIGGMMGAGAEDMAGMKDEEMASDEMEETEQNPEEVEETEKAEESEPEEAEEEEKKSKKKKKKK